MARPTKQGIEYFPLDVHIDDKIKFVEIKYGLEGFSIIIKLLQKIYSESFWCKWGEDEALLFASYINADYNKVNMVVEEALKREFFSQELFEKYSILTSKGIQKRYREGVRRRKDVEIIEDYLLIDNNFGVNDVNNSVKSQRNDGKSTQSKVKESKVNKNKGKEKKKSPKQVYDESSLYFKMATFFYEQIKQNNPDHKQPNMQKWSDDLRKLVELDKRDKDEVGYLIKWVQKHDFWQANVLSPSKLREKYDQLMIQYKKDAGKGYGNVHQFRPRFQKHEYDPTAEAF